MKCLETRRLALIDPLNREADFQDHIKQCGSCAAFVERARQYDARLANALRLPVPEGLKERILLRRSIGDYRTRKLRYALAMAASLMIAVTLRMLSWSSNGELQDAVAQHVQQHVPQSDAVEQVLDRTTGNSLPMEVGIGLNRGVGQIAFAKPCDIHEGRGAHLIMAGEKGPVTVLIMPQAEQAKKVTLKTGDLVAMITPCPRGSIAIIGAKDEALDVIHQRLEGAINWI